ncbi:MAG TPA: HAMP domain-containing sensor histidine kinase [Candidatus Saccharimonadales bacterium]|nr:HAMP domain-containing sensor histidine kinase [Candidatus Saccharimonadales bacterium]
MMQSAAVRLTLFYLAIIMALSIGFSVVIYRLSYREMDRSIPQGGFIKLVDPESFTSFTELRDRKIAESERRLKANLVLLNLGTLVVGAALSYGLARRTLEPIEEAFEAQGRFTADASHELRTPLTAMQTTIEVGLRNPKLSLSEAKELLRGTLDEVKKVSALSNGLLKLTRSNGRDIPKRRVYMDKVAAEAVSQLELAAKNKEIAIIDEVGSHAVMGDHISLKELITILLDNAIKYSASGTAVHLKSKVQGKSLLLDVSDRGAGIKATDAMYIFDRFYRADQSRSRDRVEGYGLGLPIAKQIAEMHGGSIDVRSKLGEGSTFTIKLPLANRP